MWNLTQIKAVNIVSFHQLDMSVEQEVATLIFGQNLDNDNQKANGSGKSSLIEAIAFGITGETLRKVKTDEIINDEYDDARVVLSFSNDYLNEDFVIDRTISRNKSQSVHCTVNGKEVVQASVLDYNKYILEKIGLTKDDIYANYILCRNKYKSFFDSSDKDKKEIINRFSNGILVDESIERLQEDINEAHAGLLVEENNYSKATGKLDAVIDQIAVAIEKKDEFERNKEANIKSLQEVIVNKRNEITSLKEKVESAKKRFELIDGIGAEIEDIERSDKAFSESYEAVRKLFDGAGIEWKERYSDELSSLSYSFSSSERELRRMKSAQDELSKKLDAAEKAYDTTLAKYKQQLNKVKADNQSDEESIEAIRKEIEAINALIDENNDKVIRKNNEEIAKYQKLLAEAENLLHGTVVCPKCQHRFSLKTDKPVKEIEADASNCESQIDKLDGENHKIREKNEQLAADERRKLDEINSIRKDIQVRNHDVDEFYGIHLSMRNNADAAKKDLENSMSAVKDMELRMDEFRGKIDNMRKRMFDDAFNVIDSRLDAGENFIKNTKDNISHAEGVIESYRERIKELENSKASDVMVSLEEAKKNYEKELAKASEKRDKVMVEYNALKQQEVHFTAFKTHLANTKIDAISAVTNEYLERIGSDLRVVLEGFKVLKSGKIRDKITVNILRNGVDCGSIEKLSAGEKTRICLASIIALQHLTNSACENGKGLDLIIADEILDASDIDGLMSYCEAINHLRKTAFIITQNAIAENYQHRLVVTKKNGVSTINS